MERLGKLSKLFYILAAFLLVLGMMPTAGVSAVFADDGSQPAAEPAVVAGEPAQEDAPETAVDALVESGPEETPEESRDPSSEPSSEPAEEVEELVELLSEEGIELADENGDPLPLASQEAEEILNGRDPFFWDGSQWVGYTTTGSGCPANVVCNQDDNPFQRAVNEAGSGNTIYVATGDYDEDVVVNTADLSFVGFQLVTVPDAAAPTLTIDASGYAVVKSLTLNVNFGTTNGVYANSVIVNGPNGHLNDGLALVDTGGTVEADVVIDSGDGYYVIKDAHHTGEGTYEFECGEPDVLIYQKGTSQNPSGEYRMVFKQPTHLDILDYYTTYSGDERSDIPGYLDAPLSAQERLDDLLIGVNLSQANGWNHTDERLIYWNLLGNMGNDINGQSTALNATNQNRANSITNGANDNITQNYGVWFLWPKIQNPNLKDGKPAIPVNAFATATEQARQLIFTTYLQPAVSGCTDPEALNFDPNASVDNGQCVDKVFGCMDPDAFNFDPEANVESGECVEKVYGCIDPDALNFDERANVDDGQCIEKVFGCTDPDAINFNEDANVDNGQCIPVITGCIDPDALNFDPEANTDDGSCSYPNNTTTTPPDPLPIPVTGAGGPFLIPVTGIETGSFGLQLWLLAAGAIFMAAGLLLKLAEAKKKA